MWLEGQNDECYVGFAHMVFEYFPFVAFLFVLFVCLFCFVLFLVSARVKCM